MAPGFQTHSNTPIVPNMSRYIPGSSIWSMGQYQWHHLSNCKRCRVAILPHIYWLRIHTVATFPGHPKHMTFERYATAPRLPGILWITLGGYSYLMTLTFKPSSLSGSVDGPLGLTLLGGKVTFSLVFLSSCTQPGVGLLLLPPCLHVPWNVILLKFLAFLHF